MRSELIRMLFIPRERFPTFRGRIEVLFGRELLARGHAIDLVMQADHDGIPAGPVPWCGRTVWVGRSGAGHGMIARLRRQVRGFFHDMKHVIGAARGEYAAILVSDKYLVGALAIAVGHLRGLNVFFWLTFPDHELLLWRSRQPAERLRWLLWVRGYLSSTLLYRWIIPKSDHLFVQSPQMAKNLAAHGARMDKMTSVLTGVDLADFPLVERKASPGSVPFRMVYLGTLVRERRLEELITALGMLRDQAMAVELHFIGDCEDAAYRRHLEANARAAGVSSWMEITGFLPRREALARVREADVGVSPFFPGSILDVASPTKLIEYMALGLPVVANSHPEQRLILRESRAGVCTPWGARHFARATSWLLRCSRDERERMGERGRHWVETHRSYSHLADEIECVLLAKSGACPGVSAGVASG